jgi:uncharacterized protein YuzE
MSVLRDVTPDFLSEVVEALRSDGREEFCFKMATAQVERCTYDESVDAGYIYFARPFPSLPFMKNASLVAETIPFAAPHWFNVDIDHAGNIFGIELLGRPDVVGALRRTGAL